MMIADGVLGIYALQNMALPGAMPVPKLIPKYPQGIFYADRVVGYNRQYAAMGADQYISKLVRIWELPVNVGEFAVIGNDQYRIDMVQFLRDEDGLKVCDLTLAKLEERYDCITD